MKLRASGLMSFHMFSGHIGPLLVGETSFSMTNGSEVVILLETGFPKLRTSLLSPDDNDQLLQESLDLIDERTQVAMVQLAHYHQNFKQATMWG